MLRCELLSFLFFLFQVHFNQMCSVASIHIPTFLGTLTHSHKLQPFEFLHTTPVCDKHGAIPLQLQWRQVQTRYLETWHLFKDNNFGLKCNNLKIWCVPNSWVAHAVKNLYGLATTHTAHSVPEPMPDGVRTSNFQSADNELSTNRTQVRPTDLQFLCTRNCRI